MKGRKFIIVKDQKKGKKYRSQNFELSHIKILR
jgi:hypothetical protein